VDDATRRRLLGLLGLGVRGRNVLVGVDRVREAVKSGTIRVAVVAQDASHNSREKIEGLLKAKEVPTFWVPSAAELGEVAGRESTTVIGVVEAQLAKGILALAHPAVAVQKGSRGKV
jgi:ribosomal protein L7Ae-like RNA K-turn-binding protein